MKSTVAVLGLALLAGCGADGEPTPPEVRANTTVGVNSQSGVYSRTSIGIEVKL